MPPRLWKKGVGAEADAVAGILAGSTENIRGAVAFYAKGYHPNSVDISATLEDSCFAAIFFVLINFRRKYI